MRAVLCGAALALSACTYYVMPDGSVRTQFDARNVSDPGLLQRVSDSYDRRLGR